MLNEVLNFASQESGNAWAEFSSFPDKTGLFSRLSPISFPQCSPAASGQQIAFVDSALENLDELVASLTGSKVYIIGPGQDGLSFVSEVLRSHQQSGQPPMSALHLFGHGAAGTLQLGSTTLSADNLTGYQEDLALWGQSQTGDILLYGCEVAKGPQGQDFLRQLAALTGGDLQASDDPTGSSLRGGDWDLEVAVGSLESKLAISSQGQASYSGLLALTITSNGGGSSAVINVNEGETFVTDFATDSGDTGIRYSINAGDDAALFDIHPDTGVVTFKQAPDYETPRDADGNNVYFANVIAVNGAGEGDSQFLSIVVKDVAEAGSAPVITSGGGGSSAFLRVREGTTGVIDMSVSDPDGQTEGNGITYRINAGEDAALFTIDANSGLLSFKRPRDYEAPADHDRDNIYRVNVLATDNTGKADSQFIQVAIDDAPAPIITTNGGGRSAVINIDEGNRAVTDVNATGEGNGTLVYYFNAGDDAALFDIDQSTGVITFKVTPDYENPKDADKNNVYFANVLALDTATGDGVTQFLSIVVKDVAESSSAPEIISDGGGSYVFKRVEEGTSFVLDIDATDADGDSEGNGITYRINAGEDAALFDLNAKTGVLRFKALPDYEAPKDHDSNNIYRINVLATDSSGKADSQFIEIAVNDSAEDAPLVAAVEENSTAVADLPLQDSYGRALTYSLSGPDAGKFQVNAQGKLSFKSAPDYERPADADSDNVYRFTLNGLNSANITLVREVTVTVTNQVSVYLLGGQSNMAGATSKASDLSGPEANPLSTVKIWQPGVKSFIALRPGFNSNFGDGDGFGAELGFGHALEAARASGRVNSEEIYLVKYAIGATSLDVDWNVNYPGNYYTRFNQWVGGALENLTKAKLGYQIEGMLWMQGEHDSFDADRASRYQSNLTDLIGDVRSRYGATMDFVIGRLHDDLTPNYYRYANTVRQAQESVAAADPLTNWINTDSFSVNPLDGVHFDSAGHLALGRAFAQAF